MTPEERPNLRYPLLWRGGQGRILFSIGALIVIGLLANHVLHTPHERWGTALSAGAFALMLLALSIRSFSEFIRFRHAFLVADAEGVALVRGDQRQGLAWESIRGFEWQDNLRRSRLILEAENDSLSIPLPARETFRFTGIGKALNRYLAREDDLAGGLIPESEVDRRLERFFDEPPPVEMEPNVPYRYTDPHALAWRIRTMGGTFIGLVMFASLFLVDFARFTPFPAWIYGFVLLAAPAAILGRLFDDALLIRSLNDRFLLRDGTLYLLREGELLVLPPGRASEHPFSILRFNRHGKGPFAYRIAPQFFEPDPEATL